MSRRSLPSTVSICAAGLAVCLSGCCAIWHGDLPRFERYQDDTPPRLDVDEKADSYQRRLEEAFVTPEGLLAYRILFDQEPDGSYGDHADVAFHTGIYLGSQALRYRVTGEPAALDTVRSALAGIALLHDVTGVRGLIARHANPRGAVQTDQWRPSPTLADYDYKSDVSKDQYAGVAFGLALTWAHVPDAGVRAEVARLSGAIADHLIENRMTLVGSEGETSHGNLRGRIFGIPIGVNALISMALARTAAIATGEERHLELWERLLEEGYPETAYWAHIGLFGFEKRINDHMAYLGFHALLSLENDARTARLLRSAEFRTWRAVERDRNPFFAAIHCQVLLQRGEHEDAEELRQRSLEILAEFPDDKVNWPVDYTREPYDYPRAWLRGRKCLPRTTEGMPLWRRPKKSSFWASDPFLLAGSLAEGGIGETAGADYLVAYWLLRSLENNGT